MWVKISGGVVLALLLVAVGIKAFGPDSIQHGPGMHGGGDAEPAATGSCDSEPFGHGGGAGAMFSCTDAAGAGEMIETFTCRDPQHMGLQVEREVDAGQFTVTVTDGGGTTKFSRAYSGQGSESSNVSGQDGDWQVKVTRAQDFEGSFTVQFFCG